MIVAGGELLVGHPTESANLLVPCPICCSTNFWDDSRRSPGGDLGDRSIFFIDATRHDREMAWRSHLPHLVSNSLAVTLRDAGVRRSSLGPGGRDMTRLAGGALSMWAPIVEDNAAEIVVALRACEAQLRAVTSFFDELAFDHALLPTTPAANDAPLQDAA